MAFYNYIILDGKRYATLQKAWEPGMMSPQTTRITLAGDLDATFGAANLFVWEGDIKADITPRAAEWGSPTDIETTLAKKQKLSFTDHYGVAHTVTVSGYKKRSIQPDYENSDNSLMYSVMIKGVVT